MKTIAIHLSTLLAASLVLQSCDSDIVIPALPEPEQATIEQGVTLSADKLFGIWEGSTEVGTDNTDHFEQQYRVEFQSVDDAEAIFSHWYTDASSVVRDSVCGRSPMEQPASRQFIRATIG